GRGGGGSARAGCAPCGAVERLAAPNRARSPTQGRSDRPEDTPAAGDAPATRCARAAGAVDRAAVGRGPSAPPDHAGWFLPGPARAREARRDRRQGISPDLLAATQRGCVLPVAIDVLSADHERRDDRP